MDPFLSLAQFQALWDGTPLNTAQTQAANLLLQVASDWIYNHKPGVTQDDSAAKLVTFEVVSNALRYGKYAPLQSYSRQTGHRLDAGTLANPSSALDFTDRHKEWLGIAPLAAPMGVFYDDDFADPTRVFRGSVSQPWAWD